MPSYCAHGVPTEWPFKPYDQQLEYCKHVIEAIQNKKNAILESPTGTGKTLSLLISSLAWQQSTTEAGLIYYLSRTHIQLSQAAKEMKKTAYSRVPAAVLASRKHLCLNNEVKEQSQGNDASMNRACQNAIAKNSCVYFTNYEDKLKARLDFNKVHDIEDLHSFGRANQCCPFYASKKIAETQAAIVFMPYNYVLDLSVRKSTQLKLDKSVLIVDEGHNIESSLKDSASAKISLNFLKIIQECCEKLPHKLSEAMMRDVHGLSRRKTSVLDDVPAKEPTKKKKAEENKPSMIEELSEKLTTDKLQQVSKCARVLMNCQDLLKTDKGRYLETKCDIDVVMAKLEEAGVSFSTSDMIIDTLENMATFWSIIGVVNPQVISRYIAATSSLGHFISLVYPPGTMTKPKFDSHVASLKKNYSAYMLVETEKGSVLRESNKLINWDMNLWCLNPGIGMKRVIDDSCIVGPRSIIITSGTLAPIDAMKRDLEKDFSIIKEFGHLIKDNQMKITIISHSPNNYKLDTTFKNTLLSHCLSAIGETLSSLLSVLPFGTLVFFPSYRLMNAVIRHCDGQRFWNSMSKCTTVFQEKQDQASFLDDMMKFKKIVDSKGRAVFIGVCRGKLSEGTNLERNHCRSVIIVGLPYPNRYEAQVKETLEFHKKKGDPNGERWYTCQMRRALGQAIGRVIRSKDDFGMVFLCDPRFTVFKTLVSSWIQKYYPNYATTDFKQIAQDIKDFFAGHDIDISASTLAKATGSYESSAFEFDHSVRRVNKNQPAASAAKQTTQTQEITGTIRTLDERRAAMVAQYTVDRETYNRIKLQEDQEKAEATATKKPRTDVEVIETIFTTDNRTSTTQPGSQSGKLECWVCSNEPKQPHIINCKCARVGCLSCLKGLNNKSCGKCGTKLKLKQFRPKLFNIFKKPIPSLPSKT
uniref:Regulator of telomere elongation helicase 1 n=1 Tax=Aceria tosichella TaxID=561515 RepID=A0A6G1SFY1_9ACAR